MLRSLRWSASAQQERSRSSDTVGSQWKKFLIRYERAKTNEHLYQSYGNSTAPARASEAPCPAPAPDSPLPTPNVYAESERRAKPRALLKSADGLLRGSFQHLRRHAVGFHSLIKAMLKVLMADVIRCVQRIDRGKKNST